jgi:hypothetical protein
LYSPSCKHRESKKLRAAVGTKLTKSTALIALSPSLYVFQVLFTSLESSHDVCSGNASYMIDISIQKHTSVGEADGKVEKDGDALGVMDELGVMLRESAAEKSSPGGRVRVTPRAIDNAAKIISSS